MPNPRFSVVIPAYNEADYLSRTLQSLREQDFAGDVEIIVVDNDSTDATAEIARAHGARTLFESRRGVCWARQRGTEAARGELVVSTDADTVHPVDWLSRIDAHFRANTACVALAGPCRFSPAPRWARVYPILLFGAVHLLFSLTGFVAYATATNIAFRRASFPGYDTRLTQGGDELGLLRSLRHKGRIAFDRTNVVTTSARRLYRGFAYNILVTLLYYYLVAYLVNRVAGRTVLGSAPAYRDGSPRSEGRRRSGWRRHLGWYLGVPVTVALVIWAV